MYSIVALDIKVFIALINLLCNSAVIDCYQ